MTTIREVQGSKSGEILHVAFELGLGQWKLAFMVGMGQSARLRSVPARDLEAVLREIAEAKRRLSLVAEAPVVSCYEAGRDGFWLHRWLLTIGIENVVVDSGSIEVNRRKRRAKTDHLDAGALARLLVRYHTKEKRVWSVVRVPSAADEDGRQLHRELGDLKDEQTRLSNEMKGLLFAHGIVLAEVKEGFEVFLGAARRWDGSPVPVELQARLCRSLERWRLVHAQINELRRTMVQRIRSGADAHVEKIRRLMNLAGVGALSAWTLVKEVFAWRGIQNRRQLGALVGLTPTPYISGESRREQGISKAGNKRLRRLLVELAWCWLRLQPQAPPVLWFHKRFGQGARLRKIGIVAVARKVFILLWRYLESGEVPPGVKLVDWEKKVGRQPGGKKSAA